MKKSIRFKMFLAFLVAFNYILHCTIPVHAEDIKFYEYDEQLQEYYLSKVYEEGYDEPPLMLMDDSGTGTVLPTALIHFFRDGSFVSQVDNYTNVRLSNIDRFRVSFETQYTPNDYVDVHIEITFNNTGSTLFNDIDCVQVNGEDLKAYAMQGNKIILSATTQTMKTDGVFTFNVYFKSKHNIADTITVTYTSSKNPNGATHGLLNGIIEIISNIYYGIIDIPGNIASSLSSFFDMLRVSFEAVGSAITSALDVVKTSINETLNNVKTTITNAINLIQGWLVDLLNGIIEGLKFLFIPSDDFIQNSFIGLYEMFMEKLGVLLFPFDLIQEVALQFFNLSIDPNDLNLSYDGFDFMGVQIIPSFQYNLWNVKYKLLK